MIETLKPQYNRKQRRPSVLLNVKILLNVTEGQKVFAVFLGERKKGDREEDGQREKEQKLERLDEGHMSR